MARVKGNTTPVFSLKTTAGSVTDFGSYLTAFEFTDGDGEAVTFSDVAAGYRPVAITATFVLDLGTATAFEYFNVNAGAAGVTWVYKISNAATSVTNPSWGGTLTMPPTPLFSLEKGTDVATFEVTIQLDSFTKANV